MAFSLKLRRQLTSSSISSTESVEYYTVAEVQEKLLAMYADDETLFDEEDVQRILQCFSYLRSFCQRQNGNTHQTVRMVKNCLMWRKEERLSKLSDFSFPRELYLLGAAFLHGVDFDENAILVVRAQHYASNFPLRQTFERFLCYLMFKAYETGRDNCAGWVVLFDISGISMARYDLPELMWLIKILVTYYPSGLKRIIVYNVSWTWSIARPLFMFIMGLLPNDWKGVFVFATANELSNFIPKAHLPDYIAKPNEEFVPPMPLGVKPVNEINLNALGVEESNHDLFRKALGDAVEQCNNNATNNNKHDLKRRKM